MECDMKKLFALLCALLLLTVSCGALAEDAPIFNFRNGVRWEMTPEQVTACEGAEPDVSREEGTQTGVQYLKVGVSKYSAQLIYMFRDNQLKLDMYGIADTTEDDYAYLDNALVSLYGAHADIDGTVVIEAVSAILQEDPTENYLDAYSTYSIWQLEEGTVIFLGQMDGSTELIYINPNYQATLDVTGL